MQKCPAKSKLSLGLPLLRSASSCPQIRRTRSSGLSPYKNKCKSAQRRASSPLASRYSAVHLLVRKFGGQEAPGFRPIKINAKVPSEEQALLWALSHLFLHCSMLAHYLHCLLLTHDYSMIVATFPDPTVLPPSRIAKRRPCSIATG